MPHERVVVTGMGAVSPLGANAPSSFAALVAGSCGIRASSFALSEEFDSRIAGEVVLDLAPILGAKEVRRQARFTQLALVAAREALADARWDAAPYRPERVACVIGVGLGGLDVIEEASHVLAARGPKRVSPFGLPALIPNMGAGAVSVLAGARGPCWCPATACASGTHAIGQAMHLVRAGVVDAAICGGAEACVTPLALAAFARMGALSARNAEPQRASRPFDRERDGFVLAEGAAVLVIERESTARQRGAHVHGAVSGFGASADAFHPTHPPPEGNGAIVAMNAALQDAGVAPANIGYVNAHGTGTRSNDAVEALALLRVFGEYASRLPVSSTKGATGHMLGAAGAFEAVVCLLAMQSGKLPATLNLDDPDVGVELDFIRRGARDTSVATSVSNSFGFGGQNASLVLARA
jgi:3-oxoacyl-[acyl-carrier-protein] synthase II